MRVKQINLDDEGMPESIVVHMSHDEAVYLAKLTGEQNWQSSEEIMPGGAPLNSGVFDSLSGEVFNRYYEDGVKDAEQAARSK
ncbi:hypothetical protein [Streptomyces sp. WAC05858]|uniref:hypothetical protein n=1 Tax=Streptomyces TaxID=1883 RepID=UPI000F7666BE|nr:hypothetical protein [Streptomyces sp. WAC05858]RSS32301.1 hypothetical protein EF902_46665 [Streptomyces sp. WAC05858]